MKTIPYYKILAFGFAIIFGFSQNTEGQDSTIIKYDKTGNIKYIKFDVGFETGDWVSPSSPEAFFSEILGMKGGNEFVFKTKLTRKNGTYYEIYKQFYKGIKVDEAIYILDFKDGKLRKANGQFVKISDLDTTLKITPEEASKSYAEYLNITKTEELKFVSVIAISQIEDFTSGDTTYTPRLCYKINLLNTPNEKGETGYIDAQTGKVYKSVRMWRDFATAATFYTLYSGTKTANTEYYDSNYNLADYSRDADIHTWDLNNTPWYNDLYNRVEFTDSNTSWTENEHSANYDQMALDVHWALQEIYDYFDNDHGLESFDGDNADIDAYIHATFTNGNKDNAAFGVIGDDQAFYFGDGEDIFDPIASVDVVAHEYSHGISHNLTNLSVSGHSTIQSALNEGLSDIWAVIIENEIAPEKNAWRIAEEVIDVSGKNCLRNIEDPGSAYAYTQISDTQYGDYYDDGEYEKSGVFSHWFYLLSEGGSGTNDSDHDYTVWGLGMDAATAIVFDGHTSKFANIAAYSQAADAMIEAADDIFGTNSIQSLQVENAWYAVGVGSNPGQVTITGPTNDLVCSSGASFTVNNVPSGHTVSWTCSTNLSLVSSSGNNATFNTGSSTSSAGWVQATITNDTYGGSAPVRYEVWCGKPQITNKKVDGSSYYTGFQVCPGDHYLNVTPVGGNAGTTTWTVPYGITYSVGTNTLDFTFPSNASSVAITAKSANTCGTGPNSSFYLTKKTWGCYDSYAMTLSPNPASDYVTITMLENQSLIDYAESGNTTVDVDVKTYEPTTYTINIYNNQSTKLSSVTRSGESFNVSLINLLDGTYTIEVSDGRNSYRQQLVVKRD